LIPVHGINVLNPRQRNRKVFNELVNSIAHLGLKKPITVSRRKGSGVYDLACGQGRLEAFIALGQKEIPAVVTEAEEEDCFVMSLVENLARLKPYLSRADERDRSPKAARLCRSSDRREINPQ
jgi:ParB family chromosome partitioning protein